MVFLEDYWALLVPRIIEPHYEPESDLSFSSDNEEI